MFRKQRDGSILLLKRVVCLCCSSGSERLPEGETLHQLPEVPAVLEGTRIRQVPQVSPAAEPRFTGPIPSSCISVIGSDSDSRWDVVRFSLIRSGSNVLHSSGFQLRFCFC